jgi:hypothetical protein
MCLSSEISQCQKDCRMFLDSVVIDEAIHEHFDSFEKKNLLIRVDPLLRLDLESDFLDCVIGTYGDGYQTSCQDLHIDLQRKNENIRTSCKD